MNRFKQVLPLILTSLMLFVLCWSAWLGWQSERFVERAFSGQFTIESSEQIATLPTLAYAPLKVLLNKAATEARINHQPAVELAGLYSQRRPLDPQGWLWRSLFLQRAGDIDGAKAHLKTAEFLAARTATPLTKVFNRYLELGMVEDSMSVARNLVESQPEHFRRIFYLLTRLNSDYESVVNAVIPTSGEVFNRVEADYYYKLALLDAIRAKNTELAGVVWSNTPLEMKRSSEHGLLYLSLLASKQKFLPLAETWLEYTGEEFIQGEIFESDFDRDVVEYSPCWWNGASGEGFAKWSIDVVDDTVQRSMLVEFTGEENVNFSHLKCLVGVEPGVSYTLSGRWKGQGVTTLSGPYVDVVSLGVKGVNGRSEARIGSWPWLDFEFNFQAPENIELMQLRIRRAKTDYLDSKISGRVWFDDFRLSQVSNPDSILPTPIEGAYE